MEDKNWISVIEEDDAPAEPGEIFAFDIELDSGETLSIALVRDPNEDDGWLAFENVCSHDGEGMEEGLVDLEHCSIECPRHGAQFNMKSGDVISMPAVTGIRVFDVRIHDGFIQLYL